MQKYCSINFTLKTTKQVSFSLKIHRDGTREGLEGAIAPLSLLTLPLECFELLLQSYSSSIGTLLAISVPLSDLTAPPQQEVPGVTLVTAN